MAYERKYDCIFCKFRADKQKLLRHLEKNHKSEFPEGFTSLQVLFHIVNKHPLSYKRPCRVCKAPTNWDENKGRYNILCESKQCHEIWAEKMKKDMGDKMGSNRPTSTPEGLQKMLAARKISGKYKFKDGKEFTYVGSYELETLKFMDQVMDIKSEDIAAPGPVLEYTLDGQKHFYITDIFYIPYNLIIEVKDGGNNPNTNPQMYDTRRKKIAKEKYVIEETDYNYLRLTNKDFSQLLAVFADLKMSMVEGESRRVVHVNESAVNEGYLVSPPDLKINLDKWRHGIPLWICGTSGDGKTTLSKKYQEENPGSTICHLDTLLCRLRHGKEGYEERMCNKNSHMYTEFNEDYISKTYIDLVTNKLPYQPITSADMEMTNKYFLNFFKWIIKECESGMLKNIKVIIEGCEVSIINPDWIAKQPLIIISNPRLLSLFRRAKRRNNEKDNTNIVKEIFHQIKIYRTRKFYELDDAKEEFYKKVKKEYKNQHNINENMFAAIQGAIPPTSADGVYMVNYMKNNSFSGESDIAVSDSPRFDTLYTIVDGVLVKTNESFLKDTKYNVYFVDNCKNRVVNYCINNENATITKGDLYSAIFGHRMILEDQIKYESNCKEYTDFYYSNKIMKDKINEYIRKGE